MDCFGATIIIPLVGKLLTIHWVQAFAYLCFLLYLFLGIAIIADIFMCAIEKITSKTRIVKVKTGSTNSEEDFEEVEVKLWNDTVANLTLMALGSSAPEILLSIIEIVGNNFEAGDLGPGTIVGSAAFNLLIITGVCIVSIPNNESRTIKAIKVFGVTSFFSVFAYFWLFFILVVISPNVVELWEAALTFLFFPILVALAYAADKDFFKTNKTLPKENGTMELDGYANGHFPKGKLTKRSLAKFIKELRKVDPSISDEDAACLAATYMFENESHSRLFYRVSAVRQMTGSKNIVPRLNDHLQNVYNLWKTSKGDRRKSGVEKTETDNGVEPHIAVSMKTVAVEDAVAKDLSVVQFSSPTAVVLENAGKVELSIERFGRTDNEFKCIVETLDRTAKADVDYKYYKEVITFEPEQRTAKIAIEIIDDKNWNPDKVFLVKLSLPEEPRQEHVAKGRICMMTVTIVDDDEPGVIVFAQRLITVGEGEGKVVVPVLRENGADGDLHVKWKTIDGTARSGRDFMGGDGELVFEHGIVRKEIEIPIVNDFDEEKDEYFEVMLTAVNNGAKIGKLKRIMVTITNDDSYNTAMGKLLDKVKINKDGLSIHREAWLAQFKNAMEVSPDNEELDENGEPLPNVLSLLDYVLHFMSFFWKVLFAAIPPTGILGGWLTFFVSLVVIGIITALVGDVASTFGCLIGLEAPVNAITFVALGTSLPDLFASRTAARLERYADNAIGNVTGSNSVNVFLGLGLPWLIAAIYHGAQGQIFKVPAGSLGFSVGLYTAVALIATGVLLARRMLPIFGPGELGGPSRYAQACFALFVVLWILYIGLSALQTYGVIGAS